jgi:transposase
MRPRLTNEHGTDRSVMCRSLVNNRLLAPLGPWVGPGPALAAGRSPYPRRDIVDAIRYVARTGCQWDALPVDFPPAALVKYYFTVWTRDGSLGRIHNTSREQVRQVEAPPTVGSAGRLPDRARCRDDRADQPRLRRR